MTNAEAAAFYASKPANEQAVVLPHVTMADLHSFQPTGDVFSVIVFDGCNGMRFAGIATLDEILYRYPHASSRNDDGLLELDSEGTYAVPHEGLGWDG